MTRKDKRIQHYSSSQKILLVGEGDFSFSACLARAFGSAVNMVATSLDCKETLSRKYGSSCEENLEELKKSGCKVLHEVDAHDMNKHRKLKAIKFDVIIFNFPHAGHVSWLCETDAILIERHKNLLRSFFGSASGMLKEDGEVHVSQRDDYPYSEWEVEEQARQAGFVLKEKVKFMKQNYPGYNNKRGGFIRGDKMFPLKDPFTFKFSLDRQKLTFTSSTVSGSNHNKRDDSSVQSNKKFTLEAEPLSAFSLAHQETTLTGINSNDKSFRTLKDSCTSKTFLDPEGTATITANKNVTALKDPSTSNSSIHCQGTILASTSNKNVTNLKDLFPSKSSVYDNEELENIKGSIRVPFSLDHQGTTLTSISEKNGTLKDPLIFAKLSLCDQETTLSSIYNQGISFHLYLFVIYAILLLIYQL